MRQPKIFFFAIATILLVPLLAKTVKNDECRATHLHHKKILNPSSREYLWMDEQIEKEFRPFEQGITQSQLDDICKTNQPLQRFQIISNKVIGPDGKMKNLLLTLCSMYTVDDVDFVYYLHDGFIIDKKTNSLNPPITLGPVLTSAKDDSINQAILFADWYFDPTSTENSTFDWASSSVLVNKYCTRIPWKTKKPIAIWRGGFQGYMHDYSPVGFGNTPRGKTCLLSLKHPQLINAGTNWTLENSVIQELVSKGIDPRKEFLSHKKQMRYKYLIDIDGHTCTYPGLQWKMLSNSTVIKQETKNKMWFFYNMKPWIHYVPVKEDMSDLLQKILWCKENDKQAQKIAEQGRELAINSMMPEHCLLYCYKVLKKYAQLQKFAPEAKQ